MPAISQKTARRLSGGTIVTAAAMASALLVPPAGSARADEKLVLVDKIDVGGSGLGTFDISFVDPLTGLYVLADRTNASVDFFDARDATFLTRVGGFQGAKATTSVSGPDGVVFVGHKEVWAGDGDSTMKVIDIASKTVTHTISTGGKFRVDEMAYDPTDHIVAAANNADTPAFVTLFNTDTYEVIGRITFDGSNGTPDATNGIEQPQYSPKTGLFYISVPQVGPDPAQGGVSVIDPVSMKVTNTYFVQQCSPAGLTIGPNDEALIGCGATFGTSPNEVTQSLVINLTSGVVAATIPEFGGSDEVWYDRGTWHYYLAARNNKDNTGKANPVLGVVDAKTNVPDAGTPISTTAHSVAADARSHHVFVPTGFVPPGTDPATDPANPCPDKGCIAVYLPSSIDADDGTLQARR